MSRKSRSYPVLGQPLTHRLIVYGAHSSGGPWRLTDPAPALWAVHDSVSRCETWRAGSISLSPWSPVHRALPAAPAMHMPETAVLKPGTRKGRRTRPGMCADSSERCIEATGVAGTAPVQTAAAGPEGAGEGLMLPTTSCRQNNSAERRSAATFLRS
jgi:hypothetical protein